MFVSGICTKPGVRAIVYVCLWYLCQARSDSDIVCLLVVSVPSQERERQCMLVSGICSKPGERATVYVCYWYLYQARRESDSVCLLVVSVSSQERER